MNLRQAIGRHKYRYAAVAAAAVSIAVLGLAQTAHAATYHTMRPAGATGYCMMDLSGNGGDLSLLQPCTQGNVEEWAVSPSSWNSGWVQMKNEATGLCMAADNNSGSQLYAWTCNGARAEAWLELPFNGSVGWESAQPGTAGLCADASATDGPRAWTCNSSSAQDWLGPE